MFTLSSQIHNNSITTPDPLLLVMYDWKAADIQVITLSRYSVMGIILFIAIINIIIASVMVTIIIIIISLLTNIA